MEYPTTAIVDISHTEHAPCTLLSPRKPLSPWVSYPDQRSLQSNSGLMVNVILAGSRSSRGSKDKSPSDCWDWGILKNFSQFWTQVLYVCHLYMYIYIYVLWLYIYIYNSYGHFRGHVGGNNLRFSHNPPKKLCIPLFTLWTVHLIIVDVIGWIFASKVKFGTRLWFQWLPNFRSSPSPSHHHFYRWGVETIPSHG